jgi:Interleukin-like EMT inducer
VSRCWSRATHVFLVVVVFVALTGYYTYPLILHPARTLLVGLGDYPTETSMVTWNAWATFHAPGRLFQPPFFYPYSNGVAYQQSAFFTGLLAATPLSLGLQPVHAVNLLLLASVVASGALTYFLAYSVTRQVLPSLLAGVVFAFYPNRLDHIGQFTFQQAFLYPLIVWAWCRFLLDGRWVHVLLVAIALWAQTLSSLYNAFALAFLLAALTAAIWLLRPGLFTLSRLSRAALAAVGLGLGLVPFARPYLAIHRELGFQRVLDEADVFGMDLLSILDPGQFNLLYGGHLVSLGRSEGGLFPGFVALLLSGLAVAFYGRRLLDSPRPRWIRLAALALVGTAAVALGAIGLAIAVGKVRMALGDVRILKFTRLTWPVLILPVLVLGAVALEGRRRREGALDSREWMLTAGFLVVFTYLLCLTPTLQVRGESWGTTLFHWVYHYLPGASAFRAPGRWSLVFVLPLALLVALGARALADRMPSGWGPAVLGLLLVALLAEYNIKPIPWQTLPSTPPVYQRLRAEDGDFAILQIPIYERASDAWAMLWALEHGKLVVNGHGGFALDTWNELIYAADTRDPDRFSAAVQSIYPLRYVVVHPWLLGRVWAPMVDMIREGKVAALTSSGVIGGDELYRVEGTPQTGYRIRRHFSSAWARRHPSAQYALALAEDPEVSARVEVRFNRRLLRTYPASVRDRLPLEPPLPAADRNEVEFRHVYTLPPEVTRTRSYQIGQTGVASPVDLVVRSQGREAGRQASIRVNGHELVSQRHRGYWVVGLDPGDGQPIGVGKFDTHRTVQESAHLAAFIKAFPRGSIIVVAGLDETTWQLTDQALAAFRSIGGQIDPRPAFGQSHLLVGVLGAQPGQAIEALGPGPLVVTVGRDRPAGLRLEAFELS